MVKQKSCFSLTNSIVQMYQYKHVLYINSIIKTTGKLKAGKSV